MKIVNVWCLMQQRVFTNLSHYRMNQQRFSAIMNLLARTKQRRVKVVSTDIASESTIANYTL